MHSLHEGSSLVAFPCTGQGLLHIFLYLHTRFDGIFRSFVLRRKWSSFAFPWVSQGIPRNSCPSFDDAFLCLASHYIIISQCVSRYWTLFTPGARAGFPGGTSGKAPACQCRRRSRSLCREDSLEKEMATHSSILVWEPHGQRIPVGCNSLGCKESDMAEVT